MCESIERTEGGPRYRKPRRRRSKRRQGERERDTLQAATGDDTARTGRGWKEGRRRRDEGAAETNSMCELKRAARKENKFERGDTRKKKRTRARRIKREGRGERASDSERKRERERNDQMERAERERERERERETREDRREMEEKQTQSAPAYLRGVFASLSAFSWLRHMV